MDEYLEFVRNKIKAPPVFGRDPGPLHPMLFDFQAAIDRWAIRRGRAAIFSDCGTGKSLMQLEWSRQSGDRVLIFSPLAVAEQTILEGQKIGVEVRKVARPDDGPGIQITNYEKIEHFVGAPFDAIVLDECFRGDSMVDTPSGQVPIRDLKVGDAVYSARGLDRVTAVGIKQKHKAVKVTLSDGRSIVCSEKHPFFSLQGWTPACMLKRNDIIIGQREAMRMVWSGASAGQESILRKVLLCEMEDESAGNSGQGPLSRSGSEKREGSPRMADVREPSRSCGNREGSETEPKPGSDSPRENISHTEAHWPQAISSRRERMRPNSSAESVARAAWRGLVHGIRNIIGSQAQIIPHLLQGGFGQPVVDDGCGGGWVHAWKSTGAGQEEGLCAGRVRVESVEVYESGSDGFRELSGGSDTIELYDISVAGHPSFSVEGMLVHNSSILKSLDGKTRTLLIREFSDIPRRLCCTATPSPNDLSELTNHAEFLGIMSRVEMLATFFVHDSKDSGAAGWRLKGHAQDAFWRWVAKWAVYVRTPSDLGFDDGDFRLPPLAIRQETVQSDWRPDGMLFATGLGGIGDRRKARRATLDGRVDRAAEIIRDGEGQWLVWCGLNDEGDSLEKALGDECVQISGSDSDEDKIAKEKKWRTGGCKTLITKLKMFGHGLNWQHCYQELFLGLGDSWEQYYQGIRRCWRFGQKQPVDVVIVTSDAEQSVADNVRRKEADAATMAEEIIKHAKDAMRAEVIGAEKQPETYNPTKKMHLPEWAKGTTCAA